MKSFSLRLSTRLTLASPILAASGTCGWGDHVSDLVRDDGIGALITPTLTLRPRAGNPMPRTVETTGGLLHSAGLPNPGLAAFLHDELPELVKRPYPAIVSLLGETLDEWRELGATLGAHPDVKAIELNLTPTWLLFADAPPPRLHTEEANLAAMTEAIGAVRAVTDAALIAKLSPVFGDYGLAAARAAEAGADVLSLSAAQPGVAVRPSSLQFRLPGIVGGLSGPCIKPIALYHVWQAARATSLPIIGSGGAMTADDALEFLVAGASAVAVGIANTIHPSACSTIANALRSYLEASEHASYEAFLEELQMSCTQ